MQNDENDENDENRPLLDSEMFPMIRKKANEPRTFDEQALEALQDTQFNYRYRADNDFFMSYIDIAIFGPIMIIYLIIFFFIFVLYFICISFFLIILFLSIITSSVIFLFSSLFFIFTPLVLLFFPSFLFLTCFCFLPICSHKISLLI